ncbi:MAG: M3 family metallopeptidase [Polyangiaceae bacterium]
MSFRRYSKLIALPALLLASCTMTLDPAPKTSPVTTVVIPSASTAPPEAPVLASLDIDPTQLGQTADGVTKLCDQSLARAEALLDDIRKLKDAPDAELTFESTLGKLDDVVLAMHHAADFPQLMAAVHPNKQVRDAAKECEPKVSKLDTAIFLDADVAAVIKRYAAKKETLPQVRARMLEHTLRDFKRNGLDLDETGQNRLRALNDEITRLAQEFDTNIAEATLSIEVEANKLTGLPKQFIADHKADANGKVRLTTDYPDYFPVLTYAKDRSVALELYKKFENRAAGRNVALLEKILKLRAEKAKLLGYSTWADFVLEPRMAKNSKNVATFLESVRSHLEKKGAEEFAEFRAMHVKLGGKANDPIPPSDRLYLEDQLRSQKYGLDSKELSEYFEVERVKQGVLDITSKMFGLTYKVVDEKVWHPDVKAYEAIDAKGNVVGRFYMDLYPRPDKYKHAAVFGLRETKRLSNGTRLTPIAAIVCNFPKPGDGPALMTHSDVTTFFHEFGHVLHHLLSESELASFAGTAVARDFVEAPSQMLEEWAWSRQTLDLFARHHAKGDRIPDKLFSAMQKARGFGRALNTQRQLFLAALDQSYHTTEPGFDSTKLLEEIHAKYTPFSFVQGTHFQASFGHLMGYDAGYYGYQWALSIARDLFTRFQSDGMMNAKTANDYRAAVLSKGGSDDESRLVETFLGRPPSDTAYKSYLDGN